MDRAEITDFEGERGDCGISVRAPQKIYLR